MRIIYKFRSSSLEVLHKKYLFSKFWKVLIKTPWVGSCFNKIPRHVIVLKQNFLGNFPKSLEQLLRYLCTGASVISLYLHRYFHIFPIHSHLNHTKSYGCFQVYIIIAICHSTLLLLLYFTCRIEKMQTDNAELI